MADPLRLTVVAPAEARRGAAVPITVRLTNVAAHPVEAHFLGRDIAFDIVVTDARGAVAWRRLEGQAVPSILQMRMLEPQQVLEWRATWRPTAPGDYVVWAELPSDGPTRRSARITLIVR